MSGSGTGKRPWSGVPLRKGECVVFVKAEWIMTARVGPEGRAAVTVTVPRAGCGHRGDCHSPARGCPGAEGAWRPRFLCWGYRRTVGCFGLGGILEIIPFHPCHRWGPLPPDQVIRAPSSTALDTSRLSVIETCPAQGRQPLGLFPFC